MCALKSLLYIEAVYIYPMATSKESGGFCKILVHVVVKPLYNKSFRNIAEERIINNYKYKAEKEKPFGSLYGSFSSVEKRNRETAQVLSIDEIRKRDRKS